MRELTFGQRVHKTSGSCRGWLTDGGSIGRCCHANFLTYLCVMFDAELKRCRQTPYPGLTFGMHAAVQQHSQRIKQGPTGHIVQLLCSAGGNSFNRRHALFEKPSSNDCFHIGSVCLSVKALAYFGDGQ